jgi:putative ABC transport system ATP-binding protein
MTPIVKLAGVTKQYGEGESAVTALVEANLEVAGGEVLLVEGPSGSGKTTLLSILGLLLRPSAGQVWIDGRDAATLPERALPPLRARTFGFVFQGFNLFPALSALENVTLALKVKVPALASPQDEAADLLRDVGLADRMHHLPAQLSGGQKQRVAIARALAGGPPVILGDEPTAALDSRTGLGIVELLREMASEHRRAVVIVTHDPRLETFADRIVHVHDGRVSDSVVAPRRAAIG